LNFVPDHYPTKNLLTKLLRNNIDNNEDYNYTYYTDGSLIEANSERCSMMCSIVQVKNEQIFAEFSCTLSLWPSTHHAEITAILAALLINPPEKYVTIYTDSLSLILHYDTLKSSDCHLTS